MPNAMISVILVGAWKYFPFVVISRAGAPADASPRHLYEAATMDGAGPLGAVHRHHPAAAASEVLFIVILLRAIWDFKEFDLIYLLTGGGPVTSTQTLPLLVYKAEAFALRTRWAWPRPYAVLMMLDHAGLHGCSIIRRANRMESCAMPQPPCQDLLFNLLAWAVVLHRRLPAVLDAGDLGEAADSSCSAIPPT